MLRLIVQRKTSQEILLAAYGTIAGADVELLAGEARRYHQQGKRLVLQLDGVQFIDQAGLLLLRQWLGPQLQLRGGSPFLLRLLAAGLSPE